jgi:hypothetical protein
MHGATIKTNICVMHMQLKFVSNVVATILESNQINNCVQSVLVLEFYPVLNFVKILDVNLPLLWIYAYVVA